MAKDDKKLRIAILDLNEGQPNQGMRCLREIINQYSEINNLDIEWDEYEVRLQQQLPDMSYDVFISSGGPGSPLDSKDSEWENNYFNWLQQTLDWNNNEANQQKKQVFFICHSFQLACRFFNLAQVTKRRSTAFGVFPIHMLQTGKNEILFDGLKDPFYSVDSRDYQVIEPDHAAMKAMGAQILCIEKERPHVPLQRAVMGIRFNEYMIGTQFHPEADAVGMTMYLQREDKKKTVIDNYGVDKWASMIEHLNDPDKILWTYAHLLPNFLNQCVAAQQMATV